MTIPSSPRKAGPFNGTGSQTAWPFAFKVFAASDVKVTAADAEGTETVLVLNTDYSVALNPNQETSPGGTVTYPISGSPLPAGGRLTVTGDLPYDQTLDIPSGGNFSPLALENQLDRTTMQVQQLAEEVERAVKVPVTEGEGGQLSADLAQGILRLADSADNIDTVANNLPAISAVADNVADVNTVASNIGNVAATGANIAAVVTVANDLNEPVSEIDTVATNIADVNTVGQNIGAVGTTAANLPAISTVATNIADVSTVAENVTDVTNFADVNYGPRASDPTTRNDGSASQPGDMYFNTGSKRTRVFDGTAWVEGPTAPGTYTVDVFSGDGVETAFTLSVAPVSKNNTQVFIGGVYQQKSQYDIAGTSITFATAPPTGTNNVEVASTTVASVGSVDSRFVPYAGTTAFSALSKAVLSYADYATASAAAAATLPDGQVVKVTADETHEGRRTLYGVSGGALVYQGLAYDAESTAYMPPGAGAIERTAADWNSDRVSLMDFIPEAEHDAIREGTSNYDCGTAFSLAATYAGIVTRVGSANNDVVTAAVDLPRGVIKSSIGIPIVNGVQWHGAGSGATCVVITGSGVNATAVDDPLRQYSNVRFVGMTIENGGAALDGFVGSGLIRNCGAQDVVVKGFRDNYSVTDTWTFKLQDCCGYNAGRHHINGGSGTGGLHVYGGRYDIAADHGVYMNSAAGELVMVDAAVQFGSKAAVRTDDARTVLLDKNFFEGNCIGNPSTYYADLRRSGANALSSATVTDNVMNNLADSNRNGLGVCYVEGFRMFTYRERWTRNGVNVLPVVGTGVEQVYAQCATSTARDSLLTQVAWNLQNRAEVKQTARPFGFYGEDMLNEAFAPTTKAAMNVGLPGIGVALGTYNQVPAVQAYGASSVLLLNPGGGEVRFGNGGATVGANVGNEFFGRYREAAQVTSSNITPAATTSVVLVNCSGGNRNVQLTNIVHAAGRRITVKKTDGGANLLIITPTSGGTIDGAANISTATAWASFTLVSDGTDWFIVGRN